MSKAVAFSNGYSLGNSFLYRETLIKAFPAPNLRCEAAKLLQIRAHPPEVLRKH
jgi:hypothetical protein